MHRQTIEPPKFETELIHINIQILQSVLYNAEKQIPKVRLYLEFDDQVKYKNFMNKLAPTLDQDEDMLSNSDSEAFSDENQNTGTEVNDLISLSPTQILYQQKLSRLELSIILKQHYKQSISKIMKQTGAKILIVPEKIKFFGYSEQTIEQAKSLVHDIKTKIVISCLEKFGKQAYESAFMRQKLKICGIQLGKVAEKYYYWYQFDEEKQKIINEVISELFRKSTHVFHPLIENYQALRRRLNSKYIDALIKTRALLYQKYLNHEINEDKHQLNAQLNEQKTQIIIHIPVKQQSETLKDEIERFYSQFVHFFIHYKTEQNEDIQNITLIEQKLEQKGIKWFRYEELIVLNFQKKIFGRFKNIDTQNESREKQFLDALKEVFELNLNCYIQYLGEEEKKDESEDKSIPLMKKITKQYKEYDRLFVISPKTQLVQLFLEIVDYFILKPINQDKDKKKKEQSSAFVNDIEINNTNMVDDTTTMIEQSNLLQLSSQNLSQVKENTNPVDSQDLKGPILQGLKKSLQLEGYSFWVKDFLGVQKYQDVKQVSRSKPLPKEIREELEEQLQSATNRRYQIYKVIVPQKVKCDLGNSKDVVTVFVNEKEPLLNEKGPLLNDKVNVHLLNRSKAISVNGWLLNVTKPCIHDRNYKYEVEGGKFQVIAYLKYIQG